MEFKKIDIRCPRCGNRVMTWNGITTIPMMTMCKLCGAYVKFDGETKKVTYKSKVPDRKESSGKRFY